VIVIDMGSAEDGTGGVEEIKKVEQLQRLRIQTIFISSRVVLILA
jgi:hypothetical protein